MPVSFRILPRRHLILFTYSGMVSLKETMDTVAACARHPDHHPLLTHLCDVSQVTGVERNFPKLLKMQAKISEDLLPLQGERIVLFYAPTRPGQELARMAQKSWEGISPVIVLIHDHEAAVLAYLGLKEKALSALFHMAD